MKKEDLNLKVFEASKGVKLMIILRLKIVKILLKKGLHYF